MNSPPPWSTSPEHPTPPDIIIGLHVAQHALNRTQTNTVATCGSLANDAILLVASAPVGSSHQSLLPNGRADTSRMGSASIAVQILVHLIDDVVMRISQCSHGGGSTGRYPSPSTGVGVAFDEDGLRSGTCSTDAVDSGLI